MVDPERLKLTVRRRSGTELRPLEVVADPEDQDGLREHMWSIARDQDRRGDSIWWHGEYTMQVENLSRPWMPKFTVSGA